MENLTPLFFPLSFLICSFFLPQFSSDLSFVVDSFIILLFLVPYSSLKFHRMTSQENSFSSANSLVRKVFFNVILPEQFRAPQMETTIARLASRILIFQTPLEPPLSFQVKGFHDLIDLPIHRPSASGGIPCSIGYLHEDVPVTNRLGLVRLQASVTAFSLFLAVVSGRS